MNSLGRRNKAPGQIPQEEFMSKSRAAVFTARVAAFAGAAAIAIMVPLFGTSAASADGTPPPPPPPTTDGHPWAG
jgi:hypothetical protein